MRHTLADESRVSEATKDWPHAFPRIMSPLTVPEVESKLIQPQAQSAATLFSERHGANLLLLRTPYSRLRECGASAPRRPIPLTSSSGSPRLTRRAHLTPISWVT